LPCAEAVAIGMAATAGDTQIEMIVAVNRVGRIALRMCRELIADYAPDAKVIVPETGPIIVAIGLTSQQISQVEAKLTTHFFLP